MLRLVRRHKTWSLLTLIAVLAVTVGVVLWSRASNQQAAVRTRDAMISVVDGPQHNEPVRLDTTLYLPAHTPAPAVLMAHGFGGSKDSVASDARELAGHGFVVLAYSARGFGRSTGQIALNSPDYEVADAEQLVTWLGTLPEVTSDGPGKPRVGVTGASYGGALSLMLAALDPRIRAAVPVIAYNDLAQALVPNSVAPTATGSTPAAAGSSGDGVFKRTWAGGLYSSGLGPAGGGGRGNPQNGAPAAPAPGGGGLTGGQGRQGTSGQQAGDAPLAGGQGQANGAEPTSCGRFRPEICQAYTELATTGKASQQTLDLLRRLSPASVAGQITAPTLLIQGEQDTLFGLDQADATARQIASAGGRVKVDWYEGGHDGGGPGPALRNKIAGWFQYYLSGTGSNPGTGFEYAVSGGLRDNGSPSVRTVTAPAYPGLQGTAPMQWQAMRLTGAAQSVLTPPNGSPASLTSIPGLSAALGAASSAAGGLGSTLTMDPPGTAAQFNTGVLSSQVLVAGVPRVTLQVSADPTQPGDGEAVLFAKLYDVSPNGNRTLPGGGVAPLRITGLPANGSPVNVTVDLPGVVRQVAAGHHLQLVVSTTDQAYANPVQPSVHVVALGGDGGLSIPIVAGIATSGVPTAALVGIAAVLVVAVLAALMLAVRRRRIDAPDQDLVDVPLVIRNLRKSYPGGLTAVNDLSFRVERGQVLGLLGPNGAGKTTSLRMLMGLLRPSSGEMRIFGHEVHPGAPVLSRVGSFVEGPGFLPHLSGSTNLRLFWAATGRPAEDAHVDEALEIAGLGKALRRRVGTYSQGMRQRLAIAQAMLGLPDLLILDEPTNGLDPPQIHHMRDVLRRYAAAGRTVVVSSHMLGEVEQTCTHVVVMHRGALVAAGPVAEVVAGGGEATFRVDQPQAAQDVLRDLKGVSGVHVDGPLVHANLDGLPHSAAVHALVHAGVAVEQSGPRRRLEDAFLQLVGEEAVQ